MEVVVSAYQKRAAKHACMYQLTKR